MLFEEIEILSEQEIDELRNSLIDKLNKCLTSSKVQNIEYTKEQIGNIEAYISKSRLAAKNPSYKCVVKCIFCKKQVPCTHNKHWQSSNLEGHLKKEAAKQNITTETQSNQQNSQQTPPQSSKNSTVKNKSGSSNEKSISERTDDPELDAVLGLNSK